MIRSSHRTPRRARRSTLAIAALTVAAVLGAGVLGVVPAAVAAKPVGDPTDSKAASAPAPTPRGYPGSHEYGPAGSAGSEARQEAAPDGIQSLSAAVARSISGTVHLPTGAPTEWFHGVSVFAVDSDGFPAGGAAADLTGGYTITGLAPGTYTLRVISDVYVDASNNEVSPNLVDQFFTSPIDLSGADALGRDLTLQQATTITGTVSIMTGQDVGLLELYSTDGVLISRKSIQSGYQNASDATFTITGVPAGKFLLSAAILSWNGTKWTWQASAYLNAAGGGAPQTITVTGTTPTGGVTGNVGQPATVTGTMNTYGFSGNGGAVLADTSVYQKIADGSWVRQPWDWNYNAATTNGTSSINLMVGAGTFRFGFEQPFLAPYLGNGPVTAQWWQQAGSLDTATDVQLGIGQTLGGVCGSVHPASVTFTDVPADYSFLKEISWMASKGITTGYAGDCGTKSFNPWGNVGRDAMAAFLYRYAGSPAVALPATSPFIDVSPSHPFYKEIVWLSTQGITKGWSTPAGTEFRPSQPIARDAMAAFLYRFAGSPEFPPPTTSPFQDVPTDHPFYKEITWLASTGITTGWTVPGGKEYRPNSNIARDAMAAFLYRYHNLG